MGKAEEEKDNRSPWTMTPFLHFSGRFPESRKREHIIKIRKVTTSPYVKNRALSVVLTIYKEYKKNIEKIYCLYIVNIFFLYFFRRNRQRGDAH